MKSVLILGLGFLGAQAILTFSLLRPTYWLAEPPFWQGLVVLLVPLLIVAALALVAVLGRALLRELRVKRYGMTWGREWLLRASVATRRRPLI